MNTDQLIAHSRARFDHATARKTLKEKYEAKLVFAHAGGMWRAGPELLTTLLVCQSVIGDTVLQDLYDNPIKINSKELYAECQQRWQEQMNAWLVEYEALNKNR